MRPKLLPLPFFAGLIVGLVALSWLGSVVQSRNLALDFVALPSIDPLAVKANSPTPW